MRLSTIFSIVFILHIHWVCGDTIVLPQSTEKDAIVETTPETEVKHSDDRKNISIAPGVAMNKLLAQEQTILEQEQESLESSMEVDLQLLLLYFFPFWHTYFVLDFPR